MLVLHHPNPPVSGEREVAGAAAAAAVKAVELTLLLNRK